MTIRIVALFVAASIGLTSNAQSNPSRLTGECKFLKSTGTGFSYKERALQSLEIPREEEGDMMLLITWNANKAEWQTFLMASDLERGSYFLTEHSPIDGDEIRATRVNSLPDDDDNDDRTGTAITSLSLNRIYKNDWYGVFTTVRSHTGLEASMVHIDALKCDLTYQ